MAVAAPSSQQPGEVVVVEAWLADEHLTHPAPRLNPTAWSGQRHLDAPEPGQFRHGAGIVHVILLQNAEIGIGSALQLLIQPAGASFLSPHPKKKHAAGLRG